MNLLFPVSVTVSTVIAVLLVRAAMAPGASAFQAAGFTFLATLMILAILEHWFLVFLVVPLPAAALWSWGLRSRKAVQAFDVEIVAGFLGAGKTTFLRRRLAEADPAKRTVVLVNDCSAMDVDGALLRERSANGAEVVELPNGCIGCSLRQDLGNQLKAVVARFAPDRVLIEPSGVADVAALLGVINQPELRPLVRSLRVFAMIDASAFLADFARLARYFEAQARLADVLMVNKTDLASAAEMAAVTETIRAINPDARIVPVRFGVVPAAVLAAKSVPLPEPETAHTHEHHNHHHDHHDAAHGSDHEVALGFASWSATLAGDCDPERLLALLDAIAGGGYGEVVRVKGIARVVAIGHGLDETGLQLGFNACHTVASALV
jgi:G3E family GTPase